jgi:hypothetical protein
MLFNRTSQTSALLVSVTNRIVVKRADFELGYLGGLSDDYRLAILIFIYTK